MVKWLKYSLVFVVFLVGCEEIYTPKIESREAILVADARIVFGGNNNFIRLYKTHGFYEKGIQYPPVSGAEVSILDDKNVEHRLFESIPGNYTANFSLDPQYHYKLKIITEGNTYESSFEPVPPLPDLDTVYGEAGIKIVKEGGNNSAEQINEVEGVHLYGDILNEKEYPYYRFTTRKVMQYTYTMQIGDFEETVYAWSSFYPKENFNVAAPPEFSSSTAIIKHPLTFLTRWPYIGQGKRFAGWILMLYQHGISESAYNYYNDLNNQINAQGRLFDPLYVQARGNLKCINDSTQIVLGNFEIANIKEHRFFVQYSAVEEGSYFIKTIPYFYDIPNSGDLFGEKPDFWEAPVKYYPNE